LLCEICNKDKNRGEILRLEKKEIFLCADCQEDNVVNGMQLRGGVMVVPVKLPSLETALNKKIYIRPWRKKAEHTPFLAFYYQGSILYFGRIKKIDVKVVKENIVEFLPKGERWSAKDFYTVYVLDYVDKLKNCIIRGKCPTIQSKIIVPFRKFAKATTVCDLF